MKKIILVIIAVISCFLVYVIVEQPSSNKVEIPKEKKEKVDQVEQKAKEILDQMTLEEKVGQMFIVRMPEDKREEMIQTYHLGGYIMYAKDFEKETIDSLKSKIQSYQGISSIPLFIGVDEEGGKVNRVSLYPQFRQTPFSSSQTLYEEGGMKKIISDTKEKSELLKSLGINVNFAPVSDVSTDSNDYIFARSFGKDAKKTANYVSNVTKVMKEKHMGSVLKHFPGYGNNVDTHTGIAYDERPYKTFETSDFLPFQAGIKSGADFVLVSHNIVFSMDKNYPASLSKKVHNILREKLNFDGIIITDDLYMDAIQKFKGAGEVAVLAINAGNDMICCTDFEVQIKAVIDAVAADKIKEKQIDTSVLKILKKKIELRLL